MLNFMLFIKRCIMPEELPDEKHKLQTIFTYIGGIALVLILIAMAYTFIFHGFSPPSSSNDCLCAKQFGWECDVLALNISENMMDNRIHLLNCAPVNPCNLSADRLKELRIGGCVYGNSSLEVTIRVPKHQNTTG